MHQSMDFIINPVRIIGIAGTSAFSIILAVNTIHHLYNSRQISVFKYPKSLLFLLISFVAIFVNMILASITQPFRFNQEDRLATFILNTSNGTISSPNYPFRSNFDIISDMIQIDAFQIAVTCTLMASFYRFERLHEIQPGSFSSKLIYSVKVMIILILVVNASFTVWVYSSMLLHIEMSPITAITSPQAQAMGLFLAAVDLGLSFKMTYKVLGERNTDGPFLRNHFRKHKLKLVLTLMLSVIFDIIAVCVYNLGEVAWTYIGNA